MAEKTPKEIARDLYVPWNTNDDQYRAEFRNRISGLIADERTKAEAVKEAKNRAYTERNCLVAALSKVFPSSLERHPEEDKEWDDDWRWIVFIDLPAGQATWHIHDSEMPLFDHLTKFEGRKWDGHSDEEKYIRLMSLKRSQAQHAK